MVVQGEAEDENDSNSSSVGGGGVGGGSGGSGGVNPQEATIPEAGSGLEDETPPSSPTNHNNTDKNTPKSKNGRRIKRKNQRRIRSRKTTINKNMSTATTPTTTTSTGTALPVVKKRAKRNRTVYVASVASPDYATIPEIAHSQKQQQQQQQLSIPLPMNQYNTILIRRAIRKRTTEGGGGGGGGDSNSSSPLKQQGSEQSPSRETKDDENTSDNTTPSPVAIATAADDHDDDNAEEEYGDVSLGMKLSVISGRVIVQHVNALADGRASPAQMAGLVQRGDVLLAVNYLSLVNLPIDLLMERLKPLSTPDPTGKYQRRVHLRLAAGEGLSLLQKYERAEEARKRVQVNYAEGAAATEVFSLFPMVDQLSGMPLFDPIDHSAIPVTQQQQPSSSSAAAAAPSSKDFQYQEEKKQTEEDSASPKLVSEAKNKSATGDRSSLQSSATTTLEQSLDTIIPANLAKWRALDREKFTSEFYAWNDLYSELMRPFVVKQPEKEKDDEGHSENDQTWHLSKSELQALGRRALLGAAILSNTMETLDRGKDMRSFRSWNSSISLRSRASTRRRSVFDAASLPVLRSQQQQQQQQQQQKGNASVDSDDAQSDKSDHSEMEGVDGDELLLRLAAHDEIWRRQVVEALEAARDELDRNSHYESTPATDNQISEKKNVDAAMTNGMGAFLFGETISKIVTEKKRTKALPPDEITAVLFDLSTNLASNMPDEIVIGEKSGNGLLRSRLLPCTGRMSKRAGSSVILATRFVLDEALVAWLKTFKPLPWESRRVLWPRVKISPSGGGSQSRTMFSDDDDSLSLDSGRMSPATAYSTTTNGTWKQTKDLEQQIEDQELDMEARAETCFLVTYYFTQGLLSKYSRDDDSDPSKEIEELVDFVKKYGAYLQLHNCLAYAAALKRSDVIDVLLQLAEHDLRHREVIKLFARRNALILYEPTMLSAIVKCLPLIRKERNESHRQILVDVCVSAYPDLCSWQVKNALLGAQEDTRNDNASKNTDQNLRNLYYYYLSSLLNPNDGHEVARHDAVLVEEWCVLSLAESKVGERADAKARRKNFLCVASHSSSYYQCYHRDLAMLMTLSMASHEYKIALELAGEIIEIPTLLRTTTDVLLRDLRQISRHYLEIRVGEQQEASDRALKETISLFSNLRKACSAHNIEQSFSVPDELHSWLEYKSSFYNFSGIGFGSPIFDLIEFLSKETHPSDFLQAFSLWTASHDELPDTVHVLQLVLRKGAKQALKSELSGALLRLRRARQHANYSFQDKFGSSGKNSTPEETIWSLLSKGKVAIDK